MRLTKIKICGIPFDNLPLSGALARIIAFIREGEFHFIAHPNVQHVILSSRDKGFRRAYAAVDLMLADGMPLVWLSRIVGRPLEERITGHELLPLLLARSVECGYSVFVLKGGSAAALEETVGRLRARFAGLAIAGYHAVPYDFDYRTDAGTNEEALGAIKSARPDILLVALGAPAQEKWIYGNRERLRRVSACIATGGALEIMTGKVQEAPRWVKDAGLEWCFRLCQEPRRLWKRYLLRYPLFVPIALKEIVDSGIRAASGAAKEIERRCAAG